MLAALGVSLCGCKDGKIVWFTEPRREPDVVISRTDQSPAVRDTVGINVQIEGMRRMRVRGYGLVVGLGENGSSDCPRQVREQLIQEILKRPEIALSPDGVRNIDPERLIDDAATAVVVVQGEIPAAAPSGTRFDVTVEAIAGSQTRSLEGGRLFTCDLRVFRDVSPGASLSGQVLATADGPVFLNPFGGEGEDVATTVSLRRGYILGGGKSSTDRRLALVLTSPSYQRAIAITERINARFPERDKIADAISHSKISLRLPKAYEDDPRHFLALVEHLFIPTRTGFADERTVELIDELKKPDSLHTDIALALEGIGKGVIPKLTPLYSDERSHVHFYAALAGLRLGDDAALHVMQMHALDPKSKYRLEAIEALGGAGKIGRAALPLRRCLSDDDPFVQVAAYEGLRKRYDPTLRSTVVGGDNFVLDDVEADGEPLVYAKRAKDQRIALIGGPLRFTPPVFYRQADGLLTVTAGEGDQNITVLCKHPLSGTLLEPVQVGLGVDEVLRVLGSPRKRDAKKPGLGIEYSTIVQMLHTLCSSKSINARFMLEQPDSTSELFGPLSEPGRPESEL